MEKPLARGTLTKKVANVFLRFLSAPPDAPQPPILCVRKAPNIAQDQRIIIPRSGQRIRRAKIESVRHVPKGETCIPGISFICSFSLWLHLTAATKATTQRWKTP